jgi:hypothetical protein
VLKLVAKSADVMGNIKSKQKNKERKLFNKKRKK